MKLLFITQKVDLDDDILGVYHSWISKLAQKFTKVLVVCLYKGKTELPDNVEIFSLGKESGPSRFKYVFNFYKYIWNLRNDYDTVFVHMNPIYVVLGGLFWKFYGKKISLWYNHPMGNFMAKVGIALADDVFCTSDYAFAYKYKKTKIMPVGINTDLFKPMPGIEKNSNRILFLGRISPIKKIEYLVESVKILDNRGVNFKLLIVGSPASEKDKGYESKLKNISTSLVSKGKVRFLSGVPNHKTVSLYSSSSLFINLTPTGSFDKTTLEAMACRTLVLVSNDVFKSFFSPEVQQICMFKEDSVNDLADKIEFILALSSEKKQELSAHLRQVVIEHHDLNDLVEHLYKNLMGNLYER